MTTPQKPAPTTEPERPQVRRRTEQDAELDNLIWLQKTRSSRLGLDHKR
ncbi:hypothetical protein ACFVDT_06845 [Streptomyces sp. NPDC057699]